MGIAVMATEPENTESSSRCEDSANQSQDIRQSDMTNIGETEDRGDCEKCFQVT